MPDKARHLPADFAALMPASFWRELDAAGVACALVGADRSVRSYGNPLSLGDETLTQILESTTPLEIAGETVGIFALADDARLVLAGDAVTLALLASVRASLDARADARAARNELESLSNQLGEAYEEVTLVYRLTGAMRLNRNRDEFVKAVCDELIGVMRVRSAAIAFCDAGNALTPLQLAGELDLPEDVRRRLGTDLLNRLRLADRPIMVNGLGADTGFEFLAPYASKLLAISIGRDEKLQGFIVCFDKIDDDFNTTDSKLLGSIADQTSIFVENANLFADVRGLLMGLLHAMTNAVDAKDAYTRGHSQRVATISREIALRVGLPEAVAERIYMAGLLHDVGKIGVPEEVLRKGGKLTEDEFREMRRHAEIGANILRGIPQIEDLVPGVMHHHERYDGRGYPHNLAGRDIPLVARIICIADCFDAMTSNRTYRRALPIEVAMMEVRRCSGTQFDPWLAEAFLSIGVDRLTQLLSGFEFVESTPIPPALARQAA